MRTGADKTTTLRILTTLLPADAGEALVAGADVRREPALVRRRIGYVGQLGGARPRSLYAQGAFGPFAVARYALLGGPPPDPPVALRSGGLWLPSRGSLCPSGGPPPDPPVALRSGGLWPLRRGSLCLAGGYPPDPPGRSMLRDRVQRYPTPPALPLQTSQVT